MGKRHWPAAVTVTKKSRKRLNFHFNEWSLIVILSVSQSISKSSKQKMTWASWSGCLTEIVSGLIVGYNVRIFRFKCVLSKGLKKGLCQLKCTLITESSEIIIDESSGNARWHVGAESRWKVSYSKRWKLRCKSKSKLKAVEQYDMNAVWMTFEEWKQWNCWGNVA